MKFWRCLSGSETDHSDTAVDLVLFDLNYSYQICPLSKSGSHKVGSIIFWQFLLLPSHWDQLIKERIPGEIMTMDDHGHNVF